MRLRQRNQVPDGPGDHIAVPLQIAFAAFVGSEHTSNVSRDRRLFGQHRDGTGFSCLHGYFQSTEPRSLAGKAAGMIEPWTWQAGRKSIARKAAAEKMRPQNWL